MRAIMFGDWNSNSDPQYTEEQIFVLEQMEALRAKIRDLPDVDRSESFGPEYLNFL